MVCSDCGKELIKVGELTEEEMQNSVFIKTKLENAITAFNTDNIDPNLFDRGQIYEYYASVAEQMAESRFLNKMLNYEFAKKFNVPENKMVIMDGYVFQHP